MKSVLTVHQSAGKPFSDKWIMRIGIPLVGLVMPVLVGLAVNMSLIPFLFNLLIGLVNTMLLWLGCRYILMKLWQLIPWQQKPFQHLLVEILSLSLYTFAVTGVIWLVVGRYFHHLYYREVGFAEVLFPSLAISLVISFIHEGLYFFNQWKVSFIQSENLAREHLVSQLETLKSQVNPHFLFNSLNTLTGLIEEDKDSAIEYVQQLSAFYRAIIQTRNQQLIKVEEELGLISRYFEIQKKRYGDNLQMDLAVDSATLQHWLPPLSLQMLLENAVKHNVIATGRPLKIEVEATGSRYLLIRNNLQPRENDEPSAGMGLQNIKTRFGLLTDRPVEVIRSATHFSVAVPILEV